MTTPLDHNQFKQTLLEGLAADEQIIKDSQKARDEANAAIREARERIATNERLLKAIEGPVPRKKADKPAAVQPEPETIPEPEVIGGDAKAFRPI